MIDHLYDRGVRTIGPLCHANGIAWRRDRKRLQREVPSSLFSLSLSLSLSSLFNGRAAQRASTSRSRATDDTSESSLYMVGPSPSGRRPVNGRDSLFADGISGRRTNVCMYGYGREKGIERRGRDTTRSPPKTLDRWRRYGYQSAGNQNRSIVSRKFIRSLRNHFWGMIVEGTMGDKSFGGFRFEDSSLSLSFAFF